MRKSLYLSGAALLFSINVSADILVDPKGHDAEQLALDQQECAALASQIEFNEAKEHTGKSTLRGAAALGATTAILGGNKEERRRAAGVGAVGGALAKNKAKRTDTTIENAKQREAQRKCMEGRGYSVLN